MTTRPDLTQPADSELESRRPDYENPAQALRCLADQIQAGEIGAREVAVVIDQPGLDPLVAGMGKDVDSSHTYFLLHRGASWLMNFVKENDCGGHD